MDVAASFNRALERFKPHAVPLVLGMFVAGITIGVPASVVMALFGGIFGIGVFGSMMTSAGLAAVMMALVGPVQGGYLTMAGKTVMGATPEIGDVFIAFKGGRIKEFVTCGAVMMSPMLLNVIPFVGGLLGFVGMLASGFLFFFAILMVAEGADAKTALTRSKELVLANVGTVVVLYFVSMALYFVGALACFIGVFVTMPIASLIYVETYLQLKNPQPAPNLQPMQTYDPNQGGGGGYPPG